MAFPCKPSCGTDCAASLGSCWLILSICSEAVVRLANWSFVASEKKKTWSLCIFVLWFSLQREVYFLILIVFFPSVCVVCLCGPHLENLHLLCITSSAYQPGLSNHSSPVHHWPCCASPPCPSPELLHPGFACFCCMVENILRFRTPPIHLKAWV